MGHNGPLNISDRGCLICLAYIIQKEDSHTTQLNLSWFLIAWIILWLIATPLSSLARCVYWCLILIFFVKQMWTYLKAESLRSFIFLPNFPFTLLFLDWPGCKQRGSYWFFCLKKEPGRPFPHFKELYYETVVCMEIIPELIFLAMEGC